MSSLDLVLSATEKQLLLSTARQSLVDSFNGQPPPKFSNAPKPLQLARPCFVTLMTHPAGRLRGCIGCLETQSALIENVFEFARKAAFSDPRFAPLEENGLSKIKIGISVLGPLRPFDALNTLELGRHGLQVSDGHRSGVLLAKVATEFGWDREQFLRQTCLKAGLAPEMRSQYTIAYFEEISFEEK